MARLSLSRVALCVALLAAAWYPARRFFAGGVCPPAALARDLAGKVFVVTGANTGIGFEVARQLARQNATVVMACRSAARAQGALDALRASVPHAVDVSAADLDLADLDSVRAFAAAFSAAHPRLDGLVNNAGVMMNPFARTAQGFEPHFGVNHLGHFLLTELLTPVLRAGAPSRVVLLSSRASEQGGLDLDDPNWLARRHNAYRAYADSKLAAVLHARELARRLNGSGVTAVSVHPGLVRSELFRSVPLVGSCMDSLLAPFTHTAWKSTWEGAQTTLFAALDESVPALHNGAYLADAAPVHNRAPQAYDDAAAQRLWSLSEELVGLAGAGSPAGEEEPQHEQDAAPSEEGEQQHRQHEEEAAAAGEEEQQQEQQHEEEAAAGEEEQHQHEEEAAAPSEEEQQEQQQQHEEEAAAGEEHQEQQHDEEAAAGEEEQQAQQEPQHDEEAGAPSEEEGEPRDEAPAGEEEGEQSHGDAAHDAQEADPAAEGEL